MERETRGNHLIQVCLEQGCITSLRPRAEIRKVEQGGFGEGDSEPLLPAASGFGERCNDDDDDSFYPANTPYLPLPR